MLKSLKINRAIKTKWQVIWKLTSMIKDCDRLTKHKVNQEAYLMIYQSIEKSKKKLIGLKERNFKIAKSISKFTEVNVDKTQLSRPKKLCIRKNQSNLQGKTLSLKQMKENQSNLQEEILYLRPKQLCIRKNQSNLQGKNLSFKHRERESKQFARRNPIFKTKETVYQKESKQSARKDPVF